MATASLLTSAITLQYASAETSADSASVPVAPPGFKNGSFEDPVVSSPTNIFPTGWKDERLITPTLSNSYEPTAGNQTVALHKSDLYQIFHVQAGKIRLSFDVKAAAVTQNAVVNYSLGQAKGSDDKVGVNWKTITTQLDVASPTDVRLTLSSPMGGTRDVVIDNVKVEYLPAISGTPAAVAPLQLGEPSEVSYDLVDEGGIPGHGATFGVTLPDGVEYEQNSAKLVRVDPGNTPVLVPVGGVTFDANTRKLVIPVGQGASGGRGGDLKAGDHYRVSYKIKITDKQKAIALGQAFLQSPVLSLDEVQTSIKASNVGIARVDVGFAAGGGFTKSEYQVGEQADVVVAVKNGGPEDARQVLLKIPNPSGIEGFSADGCSKVGGYLECSIPLLKNGESKEIVFSGKVLGTGPLRVHASISSGSLDTNSNNKEILYEKDSTNQIDLAVQAHVRNASGPIKEGDALKPGEKVWISVEATNNGPATSREVKVHVPLPRGTELAEKVDGYDKGLWTVGVLKTNDSATLTLPVVVPSDEPTLHVEATLDASSYEGLAEINPGNNTSEETFGIDRNAKFKVGVSVVPPAAGAPEEYSPGDRVTYKIAVTNEGPSNAKSVEITHVMPDGMTQGKWTGPEGTYYENGVWTIPNVRSGETVDLTVEGVLPADQGTTIHRVCVKGADPAIPDSRGYKSCDDANDIEGHMAVSELNVVQRAAARMTVTPEGDMSSRPLPGQQVTWSVKTDNPGVSTAKGLEIEVPVPAGVGDAEATPGSNGGSYEDGLWKPADVPIGGQAVLTLTGTVLPDHDKLDYRATLKQSKTRLDESKGSKIGDSVEKSVEVQQVAGLDVSIAAVDGKNAVKVGEQAKVKVTVANKEGPSTARNTVVEVDLPQVNGLTHDGGTDFNGEPGGEGFGTWKVGDLKSGEEKSLTLTFTPEEAKDLRFDVLAARSDAANPQECQDICGSTSVKVTADEPDDPGKPDDPGNPDDPGKPGDPGTPDNPGDPTPPPGDGQNPPAGDGGKKDDGDQSLVDQVLASTGSNALWWGGGALGAAGIGAALMIASRRRR
ncbi:hypothetical protein ACTVZO_39540 [Streptomyces sp. IBSNAI002]|uniref:hypothetical protein n=1 Tax=Streptomyces sp. IBSNAI002 TaxID=3457500 RepID=UPI003FD536FE